MRRLGRDPSLGAPVAIQLPASVARHAETDITLATRWSAPRGHAIMDVVLVHFCRVTPRITGNADQDERVGIAMKVDKSK